MPNQLMGDNGHWVQQQAANNLAKVQVYFSSSRARKLTEEKVFNGPADLFSSLGGALSIWMGISFVIVIEIAEVIVEFLADKISKT